MTTHDFPSTFPIFPLPNVVLFPDVRLPLHVFEPRYRQMTADSLAGDGVIGMVLLRQIEGSVEDPPPVFRVGCAGRVADSQLLPDGRSNLVLQGLRRFQILEEVSGSKLYRIAKTELLEDPSYSDLAPDAQASLGEARLEIEKHLVALTRRMAPRSVEMLRERMAQLDSVQLVHALAFGLDCGFPEKQGLLEAPDPVSRCGLLIRLLEFRRAESELSYAPKGVN